MSKKRRGSHTVLAVAVLALLLAGLITGCGGGSGSSSGGGESTSAGTTGEEAGGSQESGGESSEASLTASLEAELKPWEQIPASIAQTEPMKKQPSGTVAFLECDAQPCVEISEGLASAAKRMGVNYKKIPAGASPETFQAAAAQAVREKPAVLVMASLDGNLITKQLAQLKAEGVKTINWATSKDESSNFNVFYIAPTLYEELGKATVQYTMLHHGTKANMLVVNQSIYGSNQKFTEGVAKGIEEECAGCSFSEVDTLPEEVGGTAPTKVVSYIQQNPSEEYQIIPAAGFISIGLPQALKAAGLETNIVGGQSGGPNNWEDMINGDQEMSFEISLPLLGYYAMDAAGRLINGEEPLADSKIPWYQLVPAEDITFDPSKEKWTPLPNYESEFAALWSGK